MSQTHLMTSTQLLRPTSWYKQFWPWFLIVLPTAAVIASFLSLYIAFKYADQPVQDGYVQQGLTVLHESKLPNANAKSSDAPPAQ